ncbi:hypothetical protein [Amycolatopsis vastitatis]|uniref:Uncharacterized protein n=1 Tax=Amycolatopsis vastitatis TaxID=1905142 RepID=A0A229TBX9_9PSEU|nr:hypothetical protein [Amycolatopsis vastitatis]OXM68500.1 hypothetical protein CF165_13415 [Amycolatopsis vastitatis]
MNTAQSSSPRKFDRQGGRARLTRRMAAGAAAIAAAGAVSLAGAGTASASAGPCYSGIDSGTTNWAWGSCTGVSGSSHWRLHVSCTWGDTRYSSWFYGNGRTDVQCPVPESVRATQIDIIY